MAEYSDKLHMVTMRYLDAYKMGKIDAVQATCGEFFIPTIPADKHKPKCEACFPKRPAGHYIFAIAS